MRLILVALVTTALVITGIPARSEGVPDLCLMEDEAHIREGHEHIARAASIVLLSRALGYRCRISIKISKPELLEKFSKVRCPRRSAFKRELENQVDEVMKLQRSTVNIIAFEIFEEDPIEASPLETLDTIIEQEGGCENIQELVDTELRSLASGYREAEVR